MLNGLTGLKYHFIFRILLSGFVSFYNFNDNGSMHSFKYFIASIFFKFLKNIMIIIH